MSYLDRLSRINRVGYSRPASSSGGVGFFRSAREKVSGFFIAPLTTKGNARQRYNAAARVYRRSPAVVFSSFVVLILMVAIVNWIWVSTGHSSALLKSYYVDANGAPVDYTAWNGQTFKLYYWDVFGWLGSMGGTFKNLGDSFIKTFDDFAITLNDGFLTGFINVIILILNLAWSIVKLVILFPLSIVAAIFQAFMSTWITSDGWLTQAVQWHIPYLRGIDWESLPGPVWIPPV